MEDKVFRHKIICDGLNDLYARKNHDYGDSFHQTYVEEGLAMTRIRLGEKFSRFKTLSRLSADDSGQQQVTDESIRDTLMDLANYALMTILEMEENDKGDNYRNTLIDILYKLHAEGRSIAEAAAVIGVDVGTARVLSKEAGISEYS